MPSHLPTFCLALHSTSRISLGRAQKVLNLKLGELQGNIEFRVFSQKLPFRTPNCQCQIICQWCHAFSCSSSSTQQLKQRSSRPEVPHLHGVPVRGVHPSRSRNPVQICRQGPRAIYGTDTHATYCIEFSPPRFGTPTDTRLPGSQSQENFPQETPASCTQAIDHGKFTAASGVGI
jgi:hypothetical protein